MNVQNFPAANTYLSVQQVAERRRVVDSIWRWTRDGDFPKPYRFSGAPAGSCRTSTTTRRAAAAASPRPSHSTSPFEEVNMSTN